MNRPIIRLIFMACLLAGYSPVPLLAAVEAADPSKELKEVESALEKEVRKKSKLKLETQSLEGDVKRLRLEMVAAAAAIQDHEAEVIRLAALLSRLAAEEKAKSGRFRERRSQFARVLMALERMARYPPEAMIALPLSPSDTVRSAILLRAAVPEIEARARNLRADITSIAAARLEAASRRAELAKATRGLKLQRLRLDGLLADKKKSRDMAAVRSDKAVERVRHLARQARDLKDLMARLEAERKKRERQAREREENEKEKEKEKITAGPTGRFPIIESRGFFSQPAVGRLVKLYGQATETGMTHKGITIETMAQAQVIAPHGGRVVFAGPFRGYGQLLIIEHGEGYHSLLAGLGRIDSVLGQTVTGGEPVGIMGSPGGTSPALYLELRRDGRPINPLPWLAARNNKVSG